ncbi:MAG: hypothetical protein H6652_04165 [Ardenticatenaceae bacterium]|nr:hypothetical protein [Ardenticatenaceae bacterium]MCB8946379.1 hypothetical protein [Ardenticatenaceae bacterium]
MKSYETDEMGYPLDPELRALEFHLGNLAAKYRMHKYSAQKVIEEYHATLTKLYQLGWDAALDVESELPDELMPKEYLRRHSLSKE